MNYKFWLLLLLVPFVTGGRDTPGAPLLTVKWAVEKNSSLRVEGKTNVSKFSCDISQYAEEDTIICLGDPSKPIQLTGALEMDVLSFDCHSKLITKDFRKTIKADQYPVLVIRFLSLQTMPVLNGHNEAITGWVEVELAGVVKKFQLKYSFARAAAGKILLNGGRHFSFSDFKLSPPKKLGGLVKIKDSFDVQFRLTLKTV